MSFIRNIVPWIHGGSNFDPDPIIQEALSDYSRVYTWRADKPENNFQDDGNIQAVSVGDAVNSIKIDDKETGTTIYTPRVSQDTLCVLEKVGGHLVVTDPDGLTSDSLAYFEHNPSNMSGWVMNYWEVLWNTGVDGQGPMFWAQDSTLAGWSATVNFASETIVMFGGTAQTVDVSGLFVPGFNVIAYKRHGTNAQLSVNGAAFTPVVNVGTRSPGFGRKRFFLGRGGKHAAIVHAANTNSPQISIETITTVTDALKRKYGIS